jgi:hypothetical protein
LICQQILNLFAHDGTLCEKVTGDALLIVPLLPILRLVLTVDGPAGT